MLTGDFGYQMSALKNQLASLNLEIWYFQSHTGADLG